MAKSEELIGTTECLTLYTGWIISRCCYKRVPIHLQIVFSIDIIKRGPNVIKLLGEQKHVIARVLSQVVKQKLSKY